MDQGFLLSFFLAPAAKYTNIYSLCSLLLLHPLLLYYCSLTAKMTVKARAFTWFQFLGMSTQQENMIEIFQKKVAQLLHLVSCENLLPDLLLLTVENVYKIIHINTSATMKFHVTWKWWKFL